MTALHYLRYSIAFVTLVTQTMAQIQPTIIPLIGSGYTVPDEKVLVIKNLAASPASSSSTVTLNIMGSEFYVPRGQSMSLCSPIYVPGGSAISVQANNYMHVYGLLVDPADLYAEIPSKITGTYVSAGSMTGTVAVASSRPALLRMDQSGDLDLWMASSTNVLRRGESPSQWVFSQPAGPESQQFLRTTARARK